MRPSGPRHWTPIDGEGVYFLFPQRSPNLKHQQDALDSFLHFPFLSLIHVILPGLRSTLGERSLTLPLAQFVLNVELTDKMADEGPADRQKPKGNADVTIGSGSNGRVMMNVRREHVSSSSASVCCRYRTLALLNAPLLSAANSN